MPDNTSVSSAATYSVASDVVTYSSDANQSLQLFRPVHVTGAEGSKVVQDLASNSTPSVTAYGLIFRQPVVSHLHRITTGDTNAVNVKAGAGTLIAVQIYSAAAYPIYCKFHNTAGTPTAGTGVILPVGCQAGQDRDFVIPRGGKAFTTGIAMTVVQGVADADATAVLAADATIEVWYE